MCVANVMNVGANTDTLLPTDFIVNSISMNSTLGEHFTDPEAIATKICNALIRIQAERPEWIQVAIRHVSLADKKAPIVQRLSHLLRASSEHDRAIEEVIGFLEKLLDPVVAETQFYQKLTQFLMVQTSATTTASDPDHAVPRIKLIQDSHRHQQPPSFDSKSLAILLLDAENIDLSQDAENWLAKFCEHPLTLKFAFGNWKQLGDRDKQLHQRGYHLIHVSAGKNHADSKMTIVGSSIWVHLPRIKEVIVCSNDSDLETLRNTLHFQGLNVRLLQRHQQTLTLTHSQTSKVLVYQLSTPVKMPTLQEGTLFCRQYLAAMPDQKISLSQLSSEFSKQLGFSISAFVKHHNLSKTPKAFFEQSEEFRLLTQKGDPQLYVENFIQESIQSVASGLVPNAQKEFTAKALRLVIVGIVKRLLKEQEEQALDVGKVAITFRQQYGKSMKSVLKELGLGQSVPKFLQTCEKITVKKHNTKWVVALAR